MLERTHVETDAFAHALGWLNSPPLSTTDLLGKVVLVDFWTYTCINWRRTLPWLRHWANKYAEHGLAVIGVHTPEFGFEKDVDNVRSSVQAEGVSYPVAIDSDYGIWNAFDNQYWPALYFLDTHGRIRHQQFGEGDYDKLESVIVKLLAEAGTPLPTQQNSAPAGSGAEAAADWNNLRSPETYLGFGRSSGWVSTGGSVPGRTQTYGAPARLGLNQWALSGEWIAGTESASLQSAGGRILFRFHARDVHLVMGPAIRGGAIRFRVSIDGAAPGDAAGVDVDAGGLGRIEQPRMYTLIRQTAPIRDRTLEIEFQDAGAEVFVFTFG